MSTTSFPQPGLKGSYSNALPKAPPRKEDDPKSSAKNLKDAFSKAIDSVKNTKKDEKTDSRSKNVKKSSNFTASSIALGGNNLLEQKISDAKNIVVIFKINKYL